MNLESTYLASSASAAKTTWSSLPEGPAQLLTQGFALIVRKTLRLSELKVRRTNDCHFRSGARNRCFSSLGLLQHLPTNNLGRRLPSVNSNPPSKSLRKNPQSAASAQNLSTPLCIRNIRTMPTMLRRHKLHARIPLHPRRPKTKRTAQMDRPRPSSAIEVRAQPR